MLSSEVSVRYEALNMLQQLVRARASTRLRARVRPPRAACWASS